MDAPAPPPPRADPPAPPDARVPPPLPMPVLPVQPVEYRAVRARPNLYQQAAKASWVAPILVFALGYLNLTQRATARDAASAAQTGTIIGITNLLLIVAGLLLATFALSGVRAHGRAGILAPAIVGLVVNLLLLAFAVLTFIALV